MHTAELHYETFRQGSKTYFNSTRFFPEPVRSDVFLLYGFVRTADDFVDAVPQDRNGFERFRGTVLRCAGGTNRGGPNCRRLCGTGRNGADSRSGGPKHF